jgi:drug/metabolite transporter (DMT)-like permease
LKLDRRAVGYLLAFASAVTGAVRFNLAVYAKQFDFDYVSFLAYALIVGVVVSAVHVGVKDGARGFVPLRGRWHHAVIYGLLMGWSSLAHFMALDYLNETVMSSLSQTGLLVTIWLAVWLLGERFTKQEWAATALICIGALVFRPWEGGNLRGMLILLSGVVAAATASIGAKMWVGGTPPRVLLLWRNAIALALVGAYSLMFRSLPAFTTATIIACIATGLLGPYLHGLFFLQALERIEASKASLMGRVAPAVVLVISGLWLRRWPDANELLTSAVLVAGVVWLALARSKQADS